MIDGEKDIIEQAIKGEASAFGLLYNKYQPQIYRFVYLKVGHREEAEDLTHQVFLKTWQNIANYQLREFPFSTWLYEIARNQVIDYYRTKKNDLNLETIDDLPGENLAAGHLDKDLSMEKMKKAIIQLNDIQQDIIILRFIEDFSIEETALVLRKTQTAVKLIQHRAVKNLKKILRLV
jgi:RNA polymerase sigma-70 factor (ECF subfamily)